jgi:uncharacterized protein (TIGR00369 family)
MALSLAELKQVMDACEFDRWLGLVAEHVDDESLVIRMPLRTEILGTPHVDRLHGGVVASLIDATACYLLIAHLNKRVSTVNLVVEYLRPSHGEMTARAHIVKLGRQICVVSVEVTGANGKLAATGRATIAPSSVTVGEEHGVTRIV